MSAEPKVHVLDQGLKTLHQDPDKVPLLSDVENGGIIVQDDVKDHRYLSICASCMCWIIGVISLLASFSVLDAKVRGDFLSAKRHSKSALAFGVAAIVVMAFMIIAVITYCIVVWALVLDAVKNLNDMDHYHAYSG